MDFQITALDFTDDDAINRRLAVRQAHIDGAKKLKQEGHIIAGGAILDVTGKMIGSTIYLRYDSLEELKAYIASDPYSTGKVWEKIDIKTVKLADL